MDFKGLFTGLSVNEGKHLNCSSCHENLGFVEAMNPLQLSAASLVSTQILEMDRRAVEASQKLTYSLFTSKIASFSSMSISEFPQRLRMCIYNHCIEDRQKNLALIAETASLCRVLTIKPLSHLAYVVESNATGAGAAGLGAKVEAKEFSEANKVLFSKMSYDISEQNHTQAQGLIDFVKQISSVRRVTDEEFEVALEILKAG